MTVGFQISLCLGTAGAAEQVYQRWAILASPEVTTAGLPDLLTIALSKHPGLQLVEREQIAAVTAELTLGRALDTAATGERLKLGRLLKADALLFLVQEQRDDGLFLRVIISDCLYGARLRFELLPYAADTGEQLVAKIAAAVLATREHYPAGVQRIIGVPHFVSKSLSHEYDPWQAHFAYVLGSALAAYPGIAVLELEEVQAIRRELDLAGGDVWGRVVPLFIEGEFKAEGGGTKEDVAINLKLRINDGTGTLQELERPLKGVSAVVAFLQSDVPPAVLRLKDDERTKSLSVDQQIVLVAARADTFARLGAYGHAIGLREAALLLRPNDATQRRALLADYVRLLPLLQLHGTDLETCRAWLGRVEYVRAQAQEQLEYVIRRRVAGRDEALTRWRELQSGLQIAVLGPFGGPYHHRIHAQRHDPRYELVLPALAEIEADRRRFVLTLAPDIGQLTDDVAGTYVANLPGFMEERLRLRWRRDPTALLELLYLPLGHRTLNPLRGPPFPTCRADLDFIAAVLRSVARGDAELVLPLLERILATEVVPAWKPEYTAGERDAFLQLLSDSPHRAEQYLGRAARVLVDFAQRQPRDTRAADEAIAELRRLATKYLSPLPAEAAGHLRWELAAVEQDLRRLVAGEDITQYPQAYSSTASAPAGSTSSGTAETPSRREIPFRWITRDGRSLELSKLGFRPPISGLIPCGTFDVAWGPGGRVALHQEPGVLVEVVAGEFPNTHAVVWDGAYIWLVGTNVIVLTPAGDVQARFGSVEGVPPHDGLVLHSLGPGRVLAAGAFDGGRRAWYATLAVDQGTPAVTVFHEATRVRQGSDPPWLAQVAADLAGNPTGILELRPPNDPGRRWFIVRGDSFLRALRPDPWQVACLPRRSPEHAGNALAGFPDGSYLAWSDFYAASEGLYRRFLGFGRRSPDGRLGVAPDNSPSMPLNPVFTHDGYAYFEINRRLYRYDPAANRFSDVAPPPVPGTVQGGFGLSALLGLLAWDNVGRVWVVVPNESPPADNPLRAPQHVQVTDAGSGEPLGGVTVEAECNGVVQTAVTDGDGYCVVPAAVASPNYLWLYVWKAHYGTAARLRRADGLASQTEAGPLRFSLEPLRTVGGIVRDARGAPLAGAHVFLLRGDVPDPADPLVTHSWSESGSEPWDYLAVTDGDGRWQVEIFPTALEQVRVRVGHPDLPGHAFAYRRLAAAEAGALRRGALTWIPPLRLKLAGTVSADAGPLLGDARVTLVRDAGYKSERTTVATDSEGRFAFADVGPGLVRLLVQAPGRAPELRPVWVASETGPVRLALRPAATLRLRAASTDGAPLANARIGLVRWRDRPDLVWNATTDESGRAVWPDAPPEPLTFNIECEGYQPRRDLVATPQADELIITLPVPRRIRVFGRVTDARTDAPLPRFAVSPHRLEEMPSDNPNDGAGRFVYRDGAYATALDDPRQWYEGLSETERRWSRHPQAALWFMAAGFVPQRALLPADVGTEYELTVTLEPGLPLEGVVRRPDRTPVPGAHVWITVPKAVAGPAFSLHDHWAWNGILADAEGRFTLPRQGCEYLVIAAHPQHGYAELPGSNFEAQRELTLQSWGRIEGVCRVGHAGGAHEGLWITIPEPEDHEHLPYFYAAWTIRTDAQGRFTIEQVPPRPVRVARLMSTEEHGLLPDRHYRDYEVRPGQTTRVEFTPRGRPVTGRVVLPDSDLPPEAYEFQIYLRPVFPDRRPPEYATLPRAQQRKSDDEFRGSAEGRVLNRDHRTYWGEAEPDGRFRCADVAPGYYRVDIFANIAGGGPLTQRYVEHEIEIPAPGPDATTPFDLGVFTVQFDTVASTRPAP